MQLVDEAKLWAKVSRQDCDTFMSTRRLAGVQRSGGSGGDGPLNAKLRAAVAGKVGGAGSGGDAESGGGWHKLEGPGLSPAGSLAEEDAPDPEGDYQDDDDEAAADCEDEEEDDGDEDEGGDDDEDGDAEDGDSSYER